MIRNQMKYESIVGNPAVPRCWYVMCLARAEQNQLVCTRHLRLQQHYVRLYRSEDPNIHNILSGNFKKETYRQYLVTNTHTLSEHTEKGSKVRSVPYTTEYFGWTSVIEPEHAHSADAAVTAVALINIRPGGLRADMGVLQHCYL